MKLLEKGILKLNLYLLKKKTKNYPIIPCNIKTAKRIKILFDSQVFKIEAIKEHLSNLKSEKSTVSYLGYYEYNKSKEVNQIHFPNTYLFSKKDFTLLIKKPKSIQINNFISSPSDLLLILDYSNNFFLNYISKHSLSTFKIGIDGNYRKNNCNFLLSLKERKPLEYIFKQFNYYLNLIKQ